MRQWIIKILYETLDDWAKWEVCDKIKRPNIDAVMREQSRQADKLFR